MRAIRFFQKTGRKITIIGSDTAGYDKSKVECFNCHKMRHFARECRGHRIQDSRNRNQDSSRRTVNVEETSSKAMMAIDGAGFDWSGAIGRDDCPYKHGSLWPFQTLRDISYKDSELSMLKSELEKLKQEKESNQLKIENFDNASKSLDKLIRSQITDKSRKGVGFPEFEGYGPKTSKSVSENISNEVRESPTAPLVKEFVSDDKLEKNTIFPTVSKIEFVRPKQQEKPVRKPIKYAEMYRSQTPRGNQRNWNNQKSQQLGSNFMMYNKACFVCGSFDHVQAHCNYHQKERVVSGNNYTRVNYNYFFLKAHPSAYRNMVPRAVLMKTGLRPLNTARPITTAHLKTTVYSARSMSCFSKSAQSTVKRPYQTRPTLTNKNFSQKVNTTKGKFYTARQKAVNTARPNSAVVNAVRANQSSVQTRRMINEQGFISVVYEGKTHEDLHTCLFACFLSQEEPKKVIQALKDPSWIEAMQEELLQFKLQQVWTLVDLPYGKRAIGTKWVYRNKKDERGIVIRNKARLVAQGYTQEEGIDYDEVFAPVVD
ncbi:ubiquitin hydrolase [Tanacetum coccineum]